MSTTDGMTGDYDDHSQYQRDVARRGDALVAESVDALALPDPPAPVVLVDLGAATGAGSAAVLGGAARAVRARVPGRPIVCVHNDVLTNDWSQVFANVAASPDGYRNIDDPPVLPMASATSFFGPVVPLGSAHLEVSSSAAHWLREPATVAVPEGFYACEATGAARRALADQAAADWAVFVAARGEDLAPGGRLVVDCVGTEVRDGRELVTAREVLATVAAAAAEMADQGLLDADAVSRYVFPVYPRTVAEAEAPFLDEGCPLELLESRVDPVPNPYLERWRADGDAEAYATDQAAFVRGFAESALRTGLLAPATPRPDADRLLDELFARVRRRFAADPEATAFRDWTLTVVAARR
ncbi:hypothetical protein PO878_16860 [Iamia majanohamensis]|uniref:SAM-dependent methyltransferase n=1 Tax=Iamia majanohamensis TaxID=467976 RepID=A0AAF0BVA0_9ACTN|nr:hypothetical protein [Iamia majanohamensis]WCO66174.1 hypothetical protein PO878_16860 [Iamia majanohamensis]